MTHCGISAAAMAIMVAMYIIAIGWLYVTVLMALSEPNIVSGVLTFGFYGLLPVSLLMWLFGGPVRRRRSSLADQDSHQGNGSDPQQDQ